MNIGRLMVFINDSKAFDKDVTGKRRIEALRGAVYDFLFENLPEGKTEEEFKKDFDILPDPAVDKIAQILLSPLNEKPKKKILMRAFQALRDLLLSLFERVKGDSITRKY